MPRRAAFVTRAGSYVRPAGARSRSLRLSGMAATRPHTSPALRPTTCRLARPSVPIGLSRVGVRGVEKVDPHRRGAVLRPARVRGRPRTRAEGRAHVALRRGHQRGDRAGGARRVGIRRRDARDAYRRARARAPARRPRGGDDRGALSRAQAGARLRHHHAGDLHPARHGGRLRARHPPHGRRVGDRA